MFAFFLILNSCSESSVVGINADSDNIDPSTSISLETRSIDTALVAQLLEDSVFYHFVRLATVDNKLIQHYLDGDIDTSDVFAIYDLLGYGDSTWFSSYEVYNQLNIDSLYRHVELYHPDTDLLSYYQSFEGVANNIYSNYISVIENYPNEISYVLSAHLLELDLELDILLSRNSQCDQCYDDFDWCKSEARDLFGSSLVFWGGVATVAATGTAMTGPGGAFVGAITLLGGGGQAGITMAFDYRACRRAFNKCLKDNDCPEDGSGGSYNRLEHIMKK